MNTKDVERFLSSFPELKKKREKDFIEYKINKKAGNYRFLRLKEGTLEYIKKTSESDLAWVHPFDLEHISTMRMIPWDRELTLYGLKGKVITVLKI